MDEGEEIEREKEEEAEEKVSEKEEKGKGGNTNILSLIFKIFTFPFILLYKLLVKYPKVLLVIILIFAAVGVTIYLARTRPDILGISTGQDAVQSQKEVENLIDEIGKLIRLPQDDSPTVATVTDAEKLKSQPFFAEAQNGDKVLIYTNSKKIYLYRPSEKKIIEASIINIAQKETVATETPAPDNSPTP